MVTTFVIVPEQYHTLRVRAQRWGLLYCLITAPIYGFLFSDVDAAAWVFVGISLAFGAFIIALVIRDARKMKSLLRQRHIALERDSIRVVSVEPHSTLRTYSRDAVTSLRLLDEPRQHDESLMAVLKTLVSRPERNRLVVSTPAGDDIYDLVLQSHYEIVQLRKALAMWSTATLTAT